MIKDITLKTLSKLLFYTKEYWFLVTVVMSFLSIVFCFFVFDVDPFDKLNENRIQKAHCGLYNSIGVSLLRQGYYEKAKAQFEKSLTFRSYDKDALNGRLLSELFISLGSIDSDPAIVEKIRDEIRGEDKRDKLQLEFQNELRPVWDKYSADLDDNLGSRMKKYADIIEKDREYIDAYYSYGWLCYGLQKPNAGKMFEIFKKMVEVDENDYRGFHGLGYAAYMLALQETDKAKRVKLLAEATESSKRAYELIGTRFNVAMDLGEIVRTVNPQLAVRCHRLAEQFLDDPDIRGLPENSSWAFYRILNGQGQVVMRTIDDKKAFVRYSLALDSLAQHRKGGADSAQSGALHDRFNEEAKKLDTKDEVRFIYEDQKRSLEKLLSSD